MLIGCYSAETVCVTCYRRDNQQKDNGLQFRGDVSNWPEKHRRKAINIMASEIQASVFYSYEFHGQSDSCQGPAPVTFRKKPCGASTVFWKHRCDFKRGKIDTGVCAVERLSLALSSLGPSLLLYFSSTPLHTC